MWNSVDKFKNWAYIKQKLAQMVQMKYDSQKIIKTLQQFKFYTAMEANNKNSIYGTNSKFHYEADNYFVLYSLYEKQLPQIFSKISKFLLNRPIQQIPIFIQNQAKQHVFKKQQILYIFCSMLLCLIPRQPFHQNEKTYNYTSLMDFSYILSQQQYKTKTIIEYINQQLQKFQNQVNAHEQFIVQRKVQNRAIQEIIQQNKDLPMGLMTLQKDQQSIQNFYGDLKTDFANKYLGGGALLSGCVQEEIMFANHPQLYTTQLLFQLMKPNESIILTGFKKYFKNLGYGHSTQYNDKQNIKYDFHPQNKNVAKEYITAIDAIPFGYAAQYVQYNKQFIDRQLLKAYCGFNVGNPDIKRVATGNWGCGAFGGNVKIKFLIQWIACSLAKKEMIYCPYGSKNIIYNERIFTAIQKMKIGETYRLIQKASQNLSAENKRTDIYKFIDQLL